MNLYHYSYKPITSLYSVRQREEPHHKPRGLWCALDDTWKLASQGWQDADAFAHRYQVIVEPSPRILRIDRWEDMTLAEHHSVSCVGRQSMSVSLR